jgi:hypothetical protein
MAEPFTPDAAGAPEQPAAPGNPNRRALIVLGAFLAVAMLLFFVVRPLLLSGDGQGNKQALAPPVTNPAAVATTTTTAPPAPEETFEVFGSKNPFQPPNGAPGTGAGAGTTATTAPGGSAGGGTGATPTTLPGTDGSGGASGSGTEPRASQRVALLDVYQLGGATVSDVRVNSTVYTHLAPGEQFAGSYKVVSLEGTCGSFLFGDERFRLCKGEEVLK